MTTMMKVPLRFVALLCLLQFGPIQADYQLKVSVTSYNNPGNQKQDGDCCDDTFSPCNEDCDPYIGALCLRGFGDPHDQSCPLGLPNTDLAISSTVSITGTGAWLGTFQIYIEVIDEDIFTADDLLDLVYADSTRTVSSQFSSTQNFAGDSSRVTLGLRFRVTCTTGWTGSDCDECIPATGCSSEGGFCNQPSDCICNTGWTGSLCDECIPATGCSSEGGFCNQPDDCICNTGWTGSLCDECIPATGCSSVGGFCNQPGDCNCHTGWTGSLCDECIPATGCSPIGGSCNLPGECNCNTDWSGSSCSVCTLTDDCCTGQFECSNGDCIDSSDKCDGINHCSDGSDETKDGIVCPEEDDEESFLESDTAIIVGASVGGVVLLGVFVVVVAIACVACKKKDPKTSPATTNVHVTTHQYQTTGQQPPYYPGQPMEMRGY